MNDLNPFELSIASCGLGHVTRGIETWAADLTAALRERHIPVGCFRGFGSVAGEFDRTVPCVLRSSWESRVVRTLVPRRVGWRFGAGSSYALEQTTFARRLIPQLRELNVRVLHVQDPLVADVVQRACKQGWCSTKVILGHGTEEPLDFLKRIEFVQHLAPWHLQQAEIQLHKVGISKPSWTSIPNFVDSKLFQARADATWRNELQIPEDATVILCAAAIKRQHKRIDYLIDEFSQVIRNVRNSNVWLIIAGAREQDTSELIQIGKRQLGDRVRFLVDVDRSRMPSLFQAANLFTLCSLEEMMPIALLEGIASGLPCLIHDRPVMRWMAGPAAVVGDFRQKGSWAENLIGLLVNSSRQRELGLAARQHCEANFSTAAVVDRLVDYYTEVRGAMPSSSYEAA